MYTYSQHPQKNTNNTSMLAVWDYCTFIPAQWWGVLMLLAVQCSCSVLIRMQTVLGIEKTLSAM